MSPVTRIVSALDTLSTTALATSGLTVFGTSGLLLAVERSSVSTLDLVTFGTLLAAWLIALAVRPRRIRALVQSAIGLGLLLSPLVIGTASGAPWVSVTTIGFAIVIGAAFTLPVPASLSAVGVVALAEAWVIRVSPPAAIFTADEPLDGLIGPLLAVTAGSGLVLTLAMLTRLGRAFDSRQSELEVAQEQAERAGRLQRAQESVERRAHETVLNTLSGIAMGNITPDAAQRAALRDLEQVRLGVHPMPDSHLDALIDSSLEASGISDVRIDVTLPHNPVVTGPVATAMRDALVEALRNVDRHASASSVAIVVDDGATAADSLHITIRDDGVGMPPATRENFGIRGSLRRAIESIGGRVEIDTAQGSGTAVSLIVPAVEPSAPIPPLPDWESLLSTTRWGRVGLAGTGVFLLLVALPLASPFAAYLPMTLVMLMFAALSIALAIIWTEPLRRVAPLVGIALIGLLVWLAVRGDPGAAMSCRVASEVPWIIAGVSGGGSMLLLTCYRRIPARIAVLLSITGLTVLLTLAVPSECRGFSVLTTLVTTGYMIAIVGYLSWLDIRFDAARRRSLRLWHEVTAVDAERQARELAVRRWNRLTAGVATLLDGIAHGRLAPSDPAIQARAATEAGALRARLDDHQETNNAWADLEREATAAALESGVALDCVVIAGWTCDDPLPAWVPHLVRSAIENSHPHSVRLVALTDGGCDEALLVLPSPESMRSALDAVPGVTGDWTVRPEEGTQAIVLQRCIRE